MPAPLRRDSTDDGARLWVRALLRGVRKRCARCGGKGLFHSWFRQKDRCPTCGMQFEREPGFFVGAYTINLALVFGALFVLCMVLVGALGSGREPEIGIFLGVGGVIAVVTPVLGYPYARTVWSAIDLAMTPLEPVEEAEAALAVAAAGSEPLADASPGAAPELDADPDADEQEPLD